jgi:acetylornithine deacetylase
MALPTFIEMYQQLIALPSISSDDAAVDQSNKPLIDLLANWFQSLGFQVDVHRVPSTRNKYNLLASLGEGSGGLLLTGHTDTVPFDDGRWSRDPFKLTECDDKLYGLGSADMKGFFAFILDAVRDLDVKTLAKPLYVLATADEETSMAGAHYFSASTQLRPDCAIIGEPTSLTPVRAHKGHISNAIQIIGQSGHSSDPAKGINAIEIMHEAIGHLIQLRSTLQQRYHNDAFVIPYPTMNFGQIHGGDSANRICGCCELLMDIRPLPGLTLTDLDELLNQALKPIIDRWPGRLTVKHSHPPIPGYECPIHQPALKAIEKLIGKRAETVNYCTEAPFIQQLCPTLVLGPGSIEQAHQPDEYLATSFIQPTRQMLKEIIGHFCQSQLGNDR